jgi:hypothetical protein
MPTQQQIDRFTLAFHRRAMERLRTHPELKDRARQVLRRWQAQGATESGKKYREEWDALLEQDVSAIEAAVCVDGDEHAATLRGVSPLGFILDPAERMEVRREAMSA